MIVVRLLVAALWLTFGLGFVPTAVYLALGLVLFVPFPEAGRHLLKLAARAADPLGTRVCNFEGQGTLRWFPLMAGAAAVSAVASTIDADQDVLNDFDPSSGGPEQQESGADAVLGAVWMLALGWELMLFHLVVGVLLCLTLVGAVFGVRHLALAVVSLLPTSFLILRADERPPPRPPRFALRGGR